MGPSQDGRVCFRGLEYILFEILDQRPEKRPARQPSRYGPDQAGSAKLPSWPFLWPLTLDFKQNML